MYERPARPTAGARALKRFIDKKYFGNTAHFCDDHNLDPARVSRIITGRTHKRITVDFALIIKRATKGEVYTEEWASWTAKAA